MKDHWFWTAVLIAVVVWYSTITLYVGIRGTLDVRSMLRNLKARRDRED